MTRVRSPQHAAHWREWHAVPCARRRWTWMLPLAACRPGTELGLARDQRPHTCRTAACCPAAAALGRGAHAAGPLCRRGPRGMQPRGGSAGAARAAAAKHHPTPSRHCHPAGASRQTRRHQLRPPLVPSGRHPRAPAPTITNTPGPGTASDGRPVPAIHGTNAPTSFPSTPLGAAAPLLHGFGLDAGRVLASLVQSAQQPLLCCLQASRTMPTHHAPRRPLLLPACAMCTVRERKQQSP